MTKITNLPNPLQILGVKHQKKYIVSLYLLYTLQILPKIPVKYRPCCGKRKNVNFPSARVNVKEGLAHAQSEFYCT